MREDIIKDLQKVSNKDKVEGLSRFFKTGEGQYGYGDKFVGIKTPELKNIISKYYKEISIEDLVHFITNPIHEYRAFGLVCLVRKYMLKDSNKKEIFTVYKKYLQYVNNWDLVDITAPGIIGEYLYDKDKEWLYKLAISKNLWYRRISIISTFTFIRKDSFEDTLNIAKILVNDKHDLIHKAVGWMLREVGKRDIRVEEKFLKKYYTTMPRTMLRYAIEKFEESKRQMYLSGKV